MIIYRSTAREFCDSVDGNTLIDKLDASFRKKLRRSIPPAEMGAYTNSLPAMERVLRRSGIADDCGILIEFKIPLTNSRVDFIITGQDASGNDNFIIIELKQWQTASLSDAHGMVESFTGGANRVVQHPSNQALNYKNFIGDFNQNVSDGVVTAYSCAYLHNYGGGDEDPLKDVRYAAIINESPLFLRDDQTSLEQYIAEHVGSGNGMDTIDLIESGKIKPSKKLVDYVSSIMSGNQEYVLLEDQAIVYERVKTIASNANEKTVIIIKGGPGTGKSVVAVNLLSSLLGKNLNTIFVAPNSSFRDTLVKRLTKDHQATRMKSLFKGSSGFYESQTNEFDVLIVDEAHRLKSRGAFMYQGYNQVKDVVNAAQVSVFFIDDDQSIRPEDIGSVAEIKNVAEKHSAVVHEMELSAQFRCAGADGYVNWLNDVLQIKGTANHDGWESGDFDFKIVDDPNDLRRMINDRASESHSARLLAGYAWRWTQAGNGNSDAQVDDVEIPEFDFSMPWNSRKVGTTWAIDESGINQVGCIHTSQGLEFDYVGVIIGDDLSFDESTFSFDTDQSKYMDANGKRGLKNDPAELNRLVRNIYKVLMTRGMKGCYVYFTDKSTEKHFISRLTANT